MLDAKNRGSRYGFGRIARMVHADCTFERFAYDNGDVLSHSTRAGQATAYGYDAVRRRLSRTSQANGVTTSLHLRPADWTPA